MKIVVLKMLFIVSVSAKFGKHVYVEEHNNWLSAQKYCRENYIDLSPITTQWDENRLKHEVNGTVYGEFWIGLYKNNGTDWKWSGGVRATNIPWSPGEPYDIAQFMYVSVCWHNCMWPGWCNFPSSKKQPFFCFNLIVVDVKKTWEEALEHCRETFTDLTSLASETEHLLALSKIKHSHITEQVWIGLHYLEDRWLWVDSDPLVYEAWPQGGDPDHQCPIWKRCGALTKGGLWENWDCQEKLNFICY